ncbi:MAG: DUF192 domain-containing protein [Acidimicrobiales bacterium]
MAWLVRDDEVLCTLEVPTGMAGRMRGLLGRDGIDGAIVLKPTRSVHTFGMRFAIDVAFCDKEFVVVDTVCMPANRVSRPRRRSRCVIEAEAGAFERWRLAPGDKLEIRE